MNAKAAISRVVATGRRIKGSEMLTMRRLARTLSVAR
jgi:hypothetical protein